MNILLLLDANIYRGLRSLGLYAFLTVFLAFLAIHINFPPEMPWGIYFMAALSASCFAIALQRCVGIVCYQISISSKSLRECYSGKYGNEENKGE